VSREDWPQEKSKHASLSGRQSMCHGVPLQGGMGGCRMLSPLGMGMEVPSAVWNPSVDAVDLASVETVGHKLINFSADDFNWIVQRDLHHARNSTSTMV
jgi:hypothetical protein